VRELKNVLSCALAFVDGSSLETAHLRLRRGNADDGEPLHLLPLGGQPLHRIERAAIRQTLALTGGNKARAAEVLCIAVSTLYEKVKKYGLT
jgi:DNA-binding NtrC family response regulator